ncbi:type IV pilus twitching motility protein PilT [Butyrivibrio sp. AC2005]|uniref:type IV pilus twitching motility protein PilT n=1 Tax=Butyrivibrio sp. AC2005 TaxID=1280672 RepID=UPI000401FBE6|nr:PilT/PilU family type 4a pilus ATPase [Butyrivibrio sp. AC2005]
MMTLDEMVAGAKAEGASDIHIICGIPPKVRKNGELENIVDTPVTREECISIAKSLTKTEEAFNEFLKVGEFDAADTFAGSRCRIHLFKQREVPSLALRILSEYIPELGTLGLPLGVLDLPKLHKGIVLVTGETGSGKSTTLAAILDDINHHYKKHIVTLEDPIEYVYTPDLCAINQREIGKDTESFSMGLRASLREDPDVILIGEMRDRDTIETAITAAETGHLVFGTLHTGSASDSIDRMVQVFPEGAQQQIRLQLSMVLQAVLTQQLIKKKDGGRALAAEYMIVTDAIRNLIRTGNTPQIANAVATSAEIGGQTMDQSIVMLVRKGLISRDSALYYAVNKDFVSRNMN